MHFVVCLNCCNNPLLFKWGGEQRKTQWAIQEIHAETILLTIQFLVVAIEEAVLSLCSHLLPLYTAELLPIPVLLVVFETFIKHHSCVVCALVFLVCFRVGVEMR